MAWNSTRADGEILTAAEWDAVISEISTGRVAGQTTDFVSGTSTQFTLWGSSTDYAPITGSTNYAGNHGLESTFHTTLTDTTLFDCSTLLHGFMPKLTGLTSKFFSDAGSLVEISTALYSSANTYSTSGHVHTVATTLAAGFMPILDQYSSKFITSTGAYVEISTNTYSSANSTEYAPFSLSTAYVHGTSSQFAMGTSTSYVNGTSTDFVIGTSTQYAPTFINKTVVLYAGNSMLATTTYAVLTQNLTTANTINWIGGKFSTLEGDRLQWGLQFDQGWDSSNLYATFNWVPEKSVSTNSTSSVVWELSAIRVGDNSTLHNAVASVITSTDAYQGSSTAYVFHRSAETTNFLITGAGNYVTFDLTRKIASDTLTTEISILNIELRGSYASTY